MLVLNLVLRFHSNLQVWARGGYHHLELLILRQVCIIFSAILDDLIKFYKQLIVSSYAMVFNYCGERGDVVCQVLCYHSCLFGLRLVIK